MYLASSPITRNSDGPSEPMTDIGLLSLSMEGKDVVGAYTTLSSRPVNVLVSLCLLTDWFELVQVGFVSHHSVGIQRLVILVSLKKGNRVLLVCLLYRIGTGSFHSVHLSSLGNEIHWVQGKSWWTLPSPYLSLWDLCRKTWLEGLNAK